MFIQIWRHTDRMSISHVQQAAALFSQTYSTVVVAELSGSRAKISHKHKKPGYSMRLNLLCALRNSLHVQKALSCSQEIVPNDHWKAFIPSWQDCFCSLKSIWLLTAWGWRSINTIINSWLVHFDFDWQVTFQEAQSCGTIWKTSGSKSWDGQCSDGSRN